MSWPTARGWHFALWGADVLTTCQSSSTAEAIFFAKATRSSSLILASAKITSAMGAVSASRKAAGTSSMSANFCRLSKPTAVTWCS